MKNRSGLLRGAAVVGGLALGHAGWAQTMPPATPVAASAGQTDGTPVTPTGLGPTGKIARITILGNKNISTDAILAVVTEKAGEDFSAQAAEQDREAITAMGYWAAPVQLADMDDQNGGVDLTFSVTENPVISGIRFNANTLTGEPTVPAATLLAQMQTKPGQVLNDPLLRQDLETLFQPGTGFVSRQGYRFDAGAAVTIDPTSGVLTIPVVESYVQAILVTGNRRAKTADILGEIGTRPGDVYRAQAIQQDQNRLSGTGRFAAVGPIRVEPTVSGRVVLTIPVTEKG